VDDGDLCCVVEFPYRLGPLHAVTQCIWTNDVDRHITKASAQAFGVLRKTVFGDKSWNVKRRIQLPAVYGTECWIHKKMITFYHTIRCLRAILGISNRQQWSERIKLAAVTIKWRMKN